MASIIKVDKLTGKSGTDASAPITLSGDTATLGTGVTIPAAGITGTLGSGVTIPAAGITGTIGSGVTIPAAGVTGTLGSGVFPTGHVLQTKMIRYDTPVAHNNNTAVTGLRLTITPVSADSVLFMQWIIFGEAGGNDAAMWRVYKDGSVITTAGYEGQSDYAGTSPTQWDVLAGTYKAEAPGSTPTTDGFSYYIKSGSTLSQYYEPFSWHSSSATVGADYQYINRSKNLQPAGQTSYEHGVSFGMIQEIADGSSTSVVL
jgi:hypothetical protein